MIRDVRGDLNRWRRLCEAYQKWQEAYHDGEPVIRVVSDQGLVPPDYLYRVMSRTAYELAQRSGYFRPAPHERIHAANRPIRAYGSGVNSVIVRFAYDDTDGWRAKWGDELYAITNQPIPFDRATLVRG